MKKHTAEEIAAKLRHAEELAARGQSQSQICKTLGVSVMTFHRWRKQAPAAASQPAMSHSVHGLPDPDGAATFSQADKRTRIEELRLENQRLRRIVTDLLIEKMKVEEALANMPQVSRRVNK